jgi:CubicO group peptidase (beta-lactamase class C family)
MRQELESLLNRHIGEGFSGVLLVRQGDTDIIHEASGLAHRGFRIPNTTDTRFDIASVTKIFTAAAIMQHVGRGEIALDTRVMPFIGIDGTRISDDVTVYHCLTHTSGIADDADEEAGEDYELLFVDKPNYSIRETRDFLPQFAHKDPVFAPGEGVRYNNVAYVLLGLVIEKVSGMTYRDYVREHVFAPAGMGGADFCAMDGTCENLAEHYKKIEHDDGTVEWRKNIYSYPPIGSPDGGATVTARDLDRFFRALGDGQLMGAAATAQLMSPHVKRRDNESGSLWNGFGIEFELDEGGEILVMGKDGINAGVCAYARYYPSDGTSVVTLSNNESNVWKLQREIRAVLLPDQTD